MSRDSELISETFQNRGLRRSYTLDGDTRMCLGVPMQIVEIDGFTARCEARGIERQASLFLLQHEDIKVGDMVMIHVGNAIQKVSEEEAKTAWELYDEMLALEDEANARA